MSCNNTNNMNNCCNCGSASYPFEPRCRRTDNYNSFRPVPPKPAYYTAGYIKEGSSFVLCNNKPYIVDNTQDQYGPLVSISENVVNRFTRKKDESCVNVCATLNMLDNSYSNTTLAHFLTQTISNQYATLEGVLDILQNVVKFKVSFHVEDETGGTVYAATPTIPCTFCKIHATDVQDVQVTSYKNLLNYMIPAMSYDGLYNLIIDNITLLGTTIDTNEHITEGLNPYYQFINNNASINLEHDTIAAVSDVETITLASVDVHQVFPFQANLVTRFRFSFVAYTSTTITVSDAHAIWDALFEPIDSVIDDLKNSVETLTEAVSDINDNIDDIEDDVESLDTRVTDLEHRKTSTYVKNAAYYKDELVYLIAGQLYQATQNFTSDNTAEYSVAESMLADISAGKLVAVKFTS